MQDGREGPLPHFVFQDPRRILVGFAGMDDQRQAGLPGRRDMAAKALRLGLRRAEVVVVVETRLAESDDLGVTGARDELLDREVELLVRVMRMRADRAEDIGKALGDREDFGMALHPGRDRDHAVDAGGACAADHAVELVGEVGKVEVAVAVDYHDK